MMNSSFCVRVMLAGLVVALMSLHGCAKSTDNRQGGSPDAGPVAEQQSPTKRTGEQDIPAESALEAGPASQGTAKIEDVQAAVAVLKELGPSARYTLLPGDVLTEIIIRDGSTLSPEHITLFGKLTDLKKLQILNFRELDDEMAAQLAGLKNLKTLALTNSVIGDATVELIVKSLPQLIDLDLSSNTNMTNSILKTICELTGLKRLTLIQDRFNDLGTSHLSKLENLEFLDLRGNMEAGDMTMEVIGTLPKLAVLKHRSTTVSDYGMEQLAQSKGLRGLLIQDFGITSSAGEQIAKLDDLAELEIFRCQGFGSEGVLALKGKKLTRLTLRDLPMVDDQAMVVFQDLPELQRLYLHELDSISDAGLQNLGALKSLELLDIWSMSQMTDATMDVIATLPNLKQLSIRTTGVTDAAVDRLLAMPQLESLTFKENGMVTAAGLQKLAGKQWSKLDTGAGGGSE